MPNNTRVTLFVRIREAASNKIKNLRNEVGSFANGLGLAHGRLASLARLLARGSLLALGMGIFTSGLIIAAAAAIRFETAMTGVAKTVDVSAHRIRELGQTIRSMAREIPVGAVELANLAQTAGQLGIAFENIPEFIEVAAGLGVATNLSADAAATGLAQLSNVMGTSQEDFDKLASALVSMGNTTATTESNVLSMSERIAGMGRVAGFSEGDVLGFAASLSSLGIEAQLGGSGLTRFIFIINDLIRQGGPQFELLAELAGKTGDEFRAAFADDAANAIIDVFEGAQKLAEEGVSLQNIMQGLGITNTYTQQVFLRSATAADQMRANLARANREFDKGTAAQKEADRAFSGSQATLKTLLNTFGELLAIIGEELTPMLNDFSELFKYWAKESGLVRDSLIGLGVALRAILTVLIAFTLAVGGIIAAVGLLFAPLGKWRAQVSEIASVTDEANAALRGNQKVMDGLTKTIEKLEKKYDSVRRRAQRYYDLERRTGIATYGELAREAEKLADRIENDLGNARDSLREEGQGLSSIRELIDQSDALESVLQKAIDRQNELTQRADRLSSPQLYPGVGGVPRTTPPITLEGLLDSSAGYIPVPGETRPEEFDDAQLNRFLRASRSGGAEWQNWFFGLFEEGDYDDITGIEYAETPEDLLDLFVETNRLIVSRGYEAENIIREFEDAVIELQDLAEDDPRRGVTEASIERLRSRYREIRDVDIEQSGRLTPNVLGILAGLTEPEPSDVQKAIENFISGVRVVAGNQELGFLDEEQASQALSDQIRNVVNRTLSAGGGLDDLIDLSGLTVDDLPDGIDPAILGATSLRELAEFADFAADSFSPLTDAVNEFNEELEIAGVREDQLGEEHARLRAEAEALPRLIVAAARTPGLGAGDVIPGLDEASNTSEELTARLESVRDRLAEINEESEYTNNALRAMARHMRNTSDPADALNADLESLQHLLANAETLRLDANVIRGVIDNVQDQLDNLGDHAVDIGRSVTTAISGAFQSMGQSIEQGFKEAAEQGVAFGTTFEETLTGNIHRVISALGDLFYAQAAGALAVGALKNINPFLAATLFFVAGSLAKAYAGHLAGVSSRGLGGGSVGGGAGISSSLSNDFSERDANFGTVNIELHGGPVLDFRNLQTQREFVSMMDELGGQRTINFVQRP